MTAFFGYKTGFERGFAARVDFLNLVGGVMYGLKPVPFNEKQPQVLRPRCASLRMTGRNQALDERGSDGVRELPP
jgi:hypothetical protein